MENNLKNMKILSIDPGTLFSGFVVFNGQEILDFGKLDNPSMLEYIANKQYDKCVIERIASYGMAIGESTLETIFWSGRMLQVAYDAGKDVSRVLRKDVKLHICGSVRAKDSNIIQALKDRFEPDLEPGKKPKGMLKGITSDVWQAFALAVYYTDMLQNKNT